MSRPRHDLLHGRTSLALMFALAESAEKTWETPQRTGAEKFDNLL
jgi:hypothetical protein